MISVLFASVVLLITSVEAGPEINQLIDKVLSEAQEEVKALVRDEVADVPDLNKSWSRNLWPFKIGGRLTCVGGKVSHVGPFERVGDVNLKWDWGTVGFQATLRFKDMRLSYRSCEVSLGFLKSSDPLVLKASDILVKVQLSMTRSKGKCVNYVEKMAVREFGELEADMGSSVLANLKETILEYYVKRHHDRIVSRINEGLSSVSVNTQALTKTCELVFHSTL